MKALPWVIAGVGVGAILAYVALNEPDPQTRTGWDSVENVADRAWRFGSKTRFSGAGTSAAGKIKKGLGRVLSDSDLMDEGAADQEMGALKTGTGKLAHAVGETIHDLNR